VAQAVVDQGGVRLLVLYAAKGDPICDEEAAWALANLSADQAYATPLAAALAPLLRMAQSTSGAVRTQALWAIANLSAAANLKDLLGDLDALPVLLATLAASTDPAADEDLLLQTTRAVANLVVAPTNRDRALTLPTALPQLIGLCRSPLTSVQEAAARLFVNMSYEADAARAVVTAGLVPAISSLLLSLPSCEAIWVIVNLSLCPENEAALAVPQVIEPLVSLLQTAEPHVQAQAAWALNNMSASFESKAAIITSGALGALAALEERVAADSVGNDLNAASKKAISSLVEVLTPQSRRIFQRGADASAAEGGGRSRRGTSKRSPLSRIPPTGIIAGID